SCEIIGNAIAVNTSASQGGGVLCQGGRHRITLNTISGNTATRGAGCELIAITNPVVFDNNSLVVNLASGSGGGLSVINTGAAGITVSNSTFTRNEAGADGGGIHCEASSPLITTNTFIANFADNFGGGIHLFGGSVATVTGSIMTSNAAWNSGGGMALREGSG